MPDCSKDRRTSGKGMRATAMMKTETSMPAIASPKQVAAKQHELQTAKSQAEASRGNASSSQESLVK